MALDSNLSVGGTLQLPRLVSHCFFRSVARSTVKIKKKKFLILGGLDHVNDEDLINLVCHDVLTVK